eukprot:c9192_g1_i1.p1 GENE.c9192_g1_i1~~c9192_g1_i1.p1  ORF type:complete len:156 (+),score=6.96 c9192_g1_i1:1-468(+)
MGRSTPKSQKKQAIAVWLSVCPPIVCALQLEQMASKGAVIRLKKELKNLKTESVPGIYSLPLTSNILEWHYAIVGPSDSPFCGGVYHGKIKFPNDYPFKAPSIMMFTPNGRFIPETRICMSMSDCECPNWFIAYFFLFVCDCFLICSYKRKAGQK